MLWASPPDGADADGRLLVDVTEFVLLVTEFLLSFVGTRAGRKLSSDIAFQLFGASCFVMMHGCGGRQGFQCVSARAGFKGYESVSAAAAARGRSAWYSAAASTTKQVKIAYSAAQNREPIVFAWETRQLGR